MVLVHELPWITENYHKSMAQQQHHEGKTDNVDA
jgi:hypothetical protein